jgi:F0F1-type ATP synthase assembly protein I
MLAQMQSSDLWLIVSLILALVAGVFAITVKAIYDALLAFAFAALVLYFLVTKGTL